MLTLKTMSNAAANDADLVSQSLSGNREAFGHIVERYQSLICSVAYSATGSLSQSEDLAQETFVTAWKKLRDLREPHKLRSWLCGIARNLTNGLLRQQGREPSHAAEPLQEIAESHSLEPLPVERAIMTEEAEILWRSLERIPESYREPLVLFYREHQSVEKVAQALDLSEEAVHQRLSRGRKLLQQEVLAFVEGALERSNPGKAFTLGVLASLPAISFSAKAATAGAAAVTGGSVAKSAGAAGLWSIIMAPLLVLFPNYIGYRVAMAGADSDKERFHIRAFYRRASLIILGLFIPFAGVAYWLTRGYGDPSIFANVLVAGLVAILVPTMFLLGASYLPATRKYYAWKLEQEHGGVFPAPTWEYRSDTTLLGLPLIHIRVGDSYDLLKSPVKAWIAIGNRAIGGLFACGSFAMAPVCVGGIAIGLLSFGGLGIGLLAFGGIALGVWPVFGGIVIGWEGIGACAFAWKAAAGGLAFAHDYAVGDLAVAAQANTEIARAFFASSSYFNFARAINNHWYLLNLIWMIPFFVQWRIGARRQRARRKA